MDKILVEVSVGELLDKISILDIKKDKIKNADSLEHVKNEKYLGWRCSEMCSWHSVKVSSKSAHGVARNVFFGCREQAGASAEVATAASPTWSRAQLTHSTLLRGSVNHCIPYGGVVHKSTRALKQCEVANGGGILWVSGFFQHLNMLILRW